MHTHTHTHTHKHTHKHTQDFWAAAKELPDGCYTQVKVRDKIANFFIFSYIRYVSYTLGTSPPACS
jgi:hypothetical protein